MILFGGSCNSGPHRNLQIQKKMSLREHNYMAGFTLPCFPLSPSSFYPEVASLSFEHTRTQNFLGTTCSFTAGDVKYCSETYNNFKVQRVPLQEQVEPNLQSMMNAELILQKLIFHERRLIKTIPTIPNILLSVSFKSVTLSVN